MSISEMNLKQRSLLFANLAADAYGEEATVREIVAGHGFTDVEFYNLDGAQAFRFENETDVVIACRGTQPTEFNDLKADLKAFPVMAGSPPAPPPSVHHAGSAPSTIRIAPTALRRRPLLRCRRLPAPD